jgi:hypothetical protein
MAARLEAPRAGVRPVTVTAPARRAGVACPRLPATADLATTGAGYLGYALVRLAIHSHDWIDPAADHHRDLTRLTATVRTELDSAARRINATLGMIDKHPYNA